MKLSEIVRERDPELKLAVEQLARREIRAAIDSLDRRSRVHEVSNREERVAVIAREYTGSPQSTLVVSPDNRSRTAINERVHAELQARGVVSHDERTATTLVPRQEMTGAYRKWAQQYEVIDILRSFRNSRETGIQKSKYARVTRIDAKQNLVTVVRAVRTEQTCDPRRQMGVTVYPEQEKAFAAGDRPRFTAHCDDLKIAKRELGTMEGMALDGTMRLKLDSGHEMNFDPLRHPHLDHGYAVTSYCAQGQTADRVLINVDTDLAARDLLNKRMAYVSVSRGQWDARIFTDDRGALAEALSHDVSYQSAYQPQQAIAPPAKEVGQTQQHGLGPGMEIGLGM